VADLDPLDSLLQELARGGPVRATGALDAGAPRYQIGEVVGRGGMGIVCRGRDVVLHRDVALKFLRSDDPAQVERFLREARVQARLDHEHVCRVYDVGELGGMPYIAMQLVGGRTLRDVAAELPLSRKIELVEQAASAVHAAHASGLIHRDLKPSNILVERVADGATKAYVVDFGLAREIDQGSTVTRGLLGTPAYLAPEQARGDRNVDVRADVYGLGATLYEVVTGRPPFEGSMAEVLAAVLEREPIPPRELDRAIPVELETIICKCLEKDPRRRYESAQALADDLRRFRAGEPIAARPARPWARLLKAARRRPLAATIAVALCAAIAAVGLTRDRHRNAPKVSVHSMRRVTFDARCVEYPSFTPDGRSLVFDAVVDGDYEVVALDLHSGRRTRLTHTPGWDYKAILSPDGSSFAYLHMGDRGREVRVLPIAGDAVAPPALLGLSVGGPGWTADGDVIAGTSAMEIVRWHRDGEHWNHTAVTKVPNDHYVRMLAGRRDGHLVTLWQRAPDTQHVDLVDLAPDGPARVLERDLLLDSVGMSLAPDESALYYTHRSVSAENELVRRSFGDETSQVVPGGISPQNGIAIARDGKHLAYSTCKELNYVARLRPGQEPIALAQRRPWRDSLGGNVDGRRLIVRSNRSGSNQIWQLDLQTGEAKPLTGPDTVDPALSPDRRWLTYVDRGRGIHVQPLGGGRARQLTEDPTDASPNFSPDGSHIVFRRSDGLRVIPVAGGATRVITPPAAALLTASSVEDRIVYMQPAPGGQQRLMMTDWAGSRHTPVPRLTDGDYSDPRLAPDGKHLIVIVNRTRLVEVSIDGHEPPALRWDAGLDGIYSAGYAPDGDGFLLTVSVWEGDVWLADGEFP